MIPNSMQSIVKVLTLFNQMAMSEKSAEIKETRKEISNMSDNQPTAYTKRHTRDVFIVCAIYLQKVDIWTS